MSEVQRELEYTVGKKVNDYITVFGIMKQYEFAERFEKETGNVPTSEDWRTVATGILIEIDRSGFSGKAGHIYNINELANDLSTLRNNNVTPKEIIEKVMDELEIAYVEDMYLLSTYDLSNIQNKLGGYKRTILKNINSKKK